MKSKLCQELAKILSTRRNLQIWYTIYMADTQEPRGDVLMEWTFPEFIRHERSRGWYIAYIIVTLGLLVFCVLSKNYTFAMLIVLLTLVLIIRLRREPLPVHFVLYDEGVNVGNDFHPWREFKEFAIIYRPPAVKKLYLTFKTGLRPELDISLESENPIRVRQYLSERLLENAKREEEPATDQITRLLKM